MLADQVKMPEYDLASMQTLLEESYRNKLY
jgi:hypothetical protein